jgi:hypothetical protein
MITQGEQIPENDWERIDDMKKNITFGEREQIKIDLKKGYRAQSLEFE